MADYVERYSGKVSDELEKQIRQVYKQAAEEVQKKLDDFIRGHKARNAQMLQMVSDGKMSKQDYQRWMRGQVFQGDQWKQKLKDVTDVYVHADEKAREIVGGTSKNVFMEAANYTAYDLEKGMRGAVAFNVYDAKTVERLLKDDPKMLPEWKIDQPKDYKWNEKRVRNAVAQGIIQGESVEEVGERLTGELATSNAAKMDMFARTAINGAQNAGRMDRLHEAEEMGIQVRKKWLATLDQRTRDTHQALDGQEQPIDEPFVVDGMKIDYPGDPFAPPELVYNCRCTLTYVYPKYQHLQHNHERRDQLNDKNIENMTYYEWLGLASKNDRKQEEQEPEESSVGRRIVQGKDITETWERRPDQFAFEIEDVINAQGFDGFPTVVGEKEFNEAVKKSNFIAQRAYSAPDEETLKAYKEQLYSGKWYVDCSNGGANFGQGMYCAASYNGEISKQISEDMEMYSKRLDGKASTVETFTLSPDAKIIDYSELEKIAEDPQFLETLEIYESRMTGEKSVDNITSVAAILGYDAVHVSFEGIDETIILNRTKCIFLDPASKEEPKPTEPEQETTPVQKEIEFDPDIGKTPREVKEGNLKKLGYEQSEIKAVESLLDRHTDGYEVQEKADAEILQHIEKNDRIGHLLRDKSELEIQAWEREIKRQHDVALSDFEYKVESAKMDLEPGGIYANYTEQDLKDWGVWPEEPNIQEPRFYRKGEVDKDVLAFTTSSSGAGMTFLTEGEEGYIGWDVSFTLSEMLEMGYRPVAGIMSADVGRPGEAEVLFVKFDDKEEQSSKEPNQDLPIQPSNPSKSKDASFVETEEKEKVKCPYTDEMSSKGYVGLSAAESDEFIKNHHNKRIVGKKGSNTMDGSQSRRINTAFRNDETPTNPADVKLVQKLDAEINKNELPQDMTLFRGVSLDAFSASGVFDGFEKTVVDMSDFKDASGNIDFDKWGKAYEEATDKDLEDKLSRAKKLIGTTIEDKGYMQVSASSQRNIFAASEIGLQIHAPKGTNAYISDYQGESEIILGRGTSYRVLDATIATTTLQNGNQIKNIQLIVETVDETENEQKSNNTHDKSVEQKSEKSREEPKRTEETKEESYQYHATTAKAIIGIAEKGLQPNRGHVGKGIYFADNAKDALDWVDTTSTGGKTVLRVSEEYLKKEKLERYSANETGYGLAESIYNGNVPLEHIQIKVNDNGDEDDWWSLAEYLKNRKSQYNMLDQKTKKKVDKLVDEEDERRLKRRR